MSESRAIHLASAASIILIALGSLYFVPDLWKGTTATFGTMGGFLTLYGVVFAVIETWRARSASEMAKKAADQANRKVVALYNVKNLAECQSHIGFALKDLAKDGWASTSSLSRILELYTAEFHEAYRQPTSPQRLAITALQSHAASASGPLGVSALRRLKMTLVKMLSDVTAAAGGKMTETEE